MKITIKLFNIISQEPTLSGGKIPKLPNGHTNLYTVNVRYDCVSSPKTLSPKSSRAQPLPWSSVVTLHLVHATLHANRLRNPQRRGGNGDQTYSQRRRKKKKRVWEERMRSHRLNTRDPLRSGSLGSNSISRSIAKLL
ncbi:hypothetical protein CEXT_626081 [Caerostris extrusa]|uniref:Uncharacterized protein n=1 Tax=Caerostris extrusa TaxID=172846 RepID=A0AAV4XWG5_CAEEX|nr:hypothetical protein CEXT_626081 [Caerostris extrusa]